MKKDKNVKFKSFDEYMNYYSIQKEEKVSNKSKYYKMGIEIAKMASERACKHISLNQ
ncbi:MAG: hypothetical protein JXB18_10535 [Sedimentisphaerales bacterium]|nr:hypothetical protein [Sedimentisphaerales bacterium]